MMRTLRVILLGGVICLLGVTSALAIEYKESPMLRTRVAAGLLPPIEERLPEKPMVMPVLHEIGQYGGTMRWSHTWALHCSQLRMANMEPLVEVWPRGTLNVVPNIVEKWEMSEDGSVFTFYMRKGMRFSDGHPVSTEDVLFNYEDVLMNEELTPGFPTYLRIDNRSDGEPMELEIIDDYTFRIIFAGPYKLFPVVLATDPLTWNGLILPKHYLKQFHIRYTPLEELEPLIKETGFEEGEWGLLFNQKNPAAYATANLTEDFIDFPTLEPWIIVDRPAPGVTVSERNPYYWKVDKEGNQLPYVDKIRMQLVETMEMATMKILAGETNFDLLTTSLQNFPLYEENAEAGGYRVVLWNWEGANACGFMLNQTIDDPVLRKIVRDVRFRRALSLGINREEVNDAIFLGLGEPAQTAPPAGTLYFKEEYTKAYAEYDPKKANQFLDEMGLDKRDAQGWRLRPDGKRLTIPIDLRQHPQFIAVSEIVVQQWRALGIDASMKAMEMGLWYERMVANQVVMWAWSADWTANTFHDNPIWIPYAPWVSCWSPLWGEWYKTGGQKGEEPSAEAKRLFELRKIIYSADTEEERVEAGKEVFRLHIENLWVIGTVQAPKVYIVGENMRNVEEPPYDVWFNLEQVFFKE